jgi:hypothetical protein
MLHRTRGRLLPELLVGTLLGLAVSVPAAAPAGAAATFTLTRSAPTFSPSADGTRSARLAAEAAVARSRPVCTKPAVHRAIARQEHPTYRWALVGLKCAGRYAVVGLADLTDRAEFTRLLHWSTAGRWRIIDRARACAQGRVPRRIRMLACQSN